MLEVYCRAAWMSAFVNRGCSFRISLIVIPWANSLRIKSTGILVPSMVGFPAKILGSITILFFMCI